MRAAGWIVAVASLAACERRAPPAAPPPPAATEPPQAVIEPPKEDPQRGQAYRGAVEAKARAHALRTRLSDERIALVSALAAADGEQREVLKGVHELAARDVFEGNALLAIDTALESGDALFDDAHYAEACDAFARAEKDLAELLRRLEAAEPTVRAHRELDAATEAVAASRAWFAERKLKPRDPSKADEALAESRRLLDAGDAARASLRAGEARVEAEDARKEGEKFLADLAAAKEKRGVVAVSQGAWEKWIEGGVGDPDSAAPARAKLAEGDELLAKGDAAGALAAFEAAALAFESAIDASQAAQKARLAGLRAKSSPAPAPPDLVKNRRVAGAVGKALLWLARHQDDDGRWASAEFTKHDPLAEPGAGGGRAEYDVGVTALALLCFFEAGFGAKGDFYAVNVEQALRFLRASQDEAGVYGGKKPQHFIYNHAIATLAVVEAYRRSGDERLADSAARAVAFLEGARNPGMGWRYAPRSGDNDTSVTAWCVRALLAAKDAGLKVDGEAFAGGLALVVKMTEPSTGRVGYNIPGALSSRPDDVKDRFPAARSQAMTAAGLFVRLAAGEDARSEAFTMGLARILELPPEWSDDAGSIDMYYWHWATLTMRRAGRSWPRWSRAVQAVCLQHQVSDARPADEGSWDPVDAWSGYGGRVYATAITTLTLIESARPAPK